MTNNQANTSIEQSALPFGTLYASETTGSSNRLFTSYDRSSSTGLDYAVNRTYSSGQGRFTQPDPIGMASVSPADPQTLNQFAYTRNSPTDFVDPSGLLLAAPDCRSTILLDFPDGENSRRFYVIVCVEESTGGGGAGYGIGHRVPPPDQPQKPKCKQSRTAEERTAVEQKLLEVAPPGSIGNIRPAKDKNGNLTEGIMFDVLDRGALIRAIRDAGFDEPAFFPLSHLNAVNGNIFNTFEGRSPTSGDGNIGPDRNSNGIVRSLQVVIGPLQNPVDQGSSPAVATGYADFDCASPNQDVFGIAKHGGPILGKQFRNFGRAIGRGMKKLGRGIRSIFPF